MVLTSLLEVCECCDEIGLNVLLGCFLSLVGRFADLLVLVVTKGF